MPDATIGRGLIDVAKAICPADGDLSATYYRRAISTAYYALFHALAARCANELVGNNPADRSNNAWVEVYRGLDHGICEKSCKDAEGVNFPQDIKDLCAEFLQLSTHRKLADYDPRFSPSREDALNMIALAETCIGVVENTPRVDMVAFATWILITSQGARHARSMARPKKRANQQAA